MSETPSQQGFWQRLGCRLLGRWLRFRSIDPEHPQALVDTGDRPVIYILPVSALSDRMALSIFCQRYGLPSPEGSILLSHGRRFPARLALFDAAHYRHHRGHVDRSASLDHLINALEQHPDSDVALIPVTLFWGRAPQREHVGLRHLLTADGWSLVGRLQRLAGMIINGRSLEIRLGEPVSLRTLMAHGDVDQQFNRTRITRFLRRYFRRVRLQAIGPDLSHRRTLIRRVLRQPAVRAAAHQSALERGESDDRALSRAERYGFEIAANMSAPVLRFLYQALGRLWNRLYDGVDVHGIEDVEALAGTHELVYVPCHRSHIDYLLLSYVLYQQGLMPPHIAAGRNLDMPLIGPLLRRAGAFFMRRSFKGNRLYGAVFNEYLHQLLSQGHPVEYFIEGGRSRTGRMLAPRPGMLSMTLRSHARVPNREMAFVPIYIGYEKVLESNAYIRELRTGEKRKETPLGLLRVLRHLRQPFGRVQVSVGEPLVLGDYLDQRFPDWRSQGNGTDADWLREAVPDLSLEIATRINHAAALTPISMVALTILATPHRTIEIDLLMRQLKTLYALQDQLPGGKRVRLPAQGPQEWIARSEYLGMVSRIEHSLGDLITVSDERAPLLTWYRNNVLHLFALHALVAFAFRNNTRLDFATLESLLAPIWPALQQEFFIEDDTQDFAERLRNVLDVFVAQGLLTQHDDNWQRPGTGDEARERLYLLGRAIQPTLERGFILFSTLMHYPNGTISREMLEAQSQLLAERLTRLQGLNAPEFFDRRLFAGLLDTLERDGWLWQSQERLNFDTRLPDALMKSRMLFDPTLLHRLTELTAGRPHTEASA
ncbi:glycerol-3-phosphate acyltransferase [Kushneria pakistanensis]|uniref:Glycerol-3-phosphate acyltransferase n=1 Tax=Kushneria pakistanensis TaxID=1508770 RepID=A0ABQ3FAL7_9GAMM|nr:glycerol-3-phosphate 1-O-acyltransferase PlsB [Kushneria pakistanensis]GHC16053.1 glycerol-3-phosphate acyltransferase [Kushneria pakistanensis]